LKRILFLTHRIPFPEHDGGAICTSYLLQGFLKAGIELSVISLNTSKHFVNTNDLPNWYKSLHNFETIRINNDITPIGALKNLLTSESYHTIRFKSEELNYCIKKFLESNTIDAVILDNIFLTDCIDTIRSNTKATIACRVHNIEFTIWEKLAHGTRNWLKKKYLLEQSKRLKEAELTTWKKVDALLCLNNHEADAIAANGIATPCIHLPFGVIQFVEKENPIHRIQANSCFHLASMDWLPNQEALDWFLDKIFPKVLAKNPNFVLHIAGKAMPDKYFTLQSENIVVHGKVDNAKEFMRQNGICIVPLLSGAGVRVKIVEAVANGIPVVSTSLGASGLPLQNGKHIAVADKANQFAEELLQPLEYWESIQLNCIQEGKDLFDMQKIVKHFLKEFSTFASHA
jgi:polysaccharide biosynthesis protein PslH